MPDLDGSRTLRARLQASNAGQSECSTRRPSLLPCWRRRSPPPGQEHERRENYAYDALGNRIRRSVNGSMVSAYVHDAANQLTQVTDAGGSVVQVSGAIRYTHSRCSGDVFERLGGQQDEDVVKRAEGVQADAPVAGGIQHRLGRSAPEERGDDGVGVSDDAHARPVRRRSRRRSLPR